MSKWSKGVVLAVVILLTAVAIPVTAANSYWQRMEEGFPNSVMVFDHVYEYGGPELEVTARIPQLAGVSDSSWQAEFNQNMRERLELYLTELKETAAIMAEDQPEDYIFFPYEGIVDFEVKLNQGGLLSIAILNYTFTGGAHGMTFYDYINLDLTSGHEIGFDQLFDTAEEVKRAAAVIDAAMAEEPEQFFAATFSADQFGENQGFYLQDTHAVICFGLYELAPYSAGIQEFAISAP